MYLLLLEPKVRSLKTVPTITFHWDIICSGCILAFLVNIILRPFLWALIIQSSYRSVCRNCICYVLNTNPDSGLKIWRKLISGPAFTFCLFVLLRVLGEQRSSDSGLTFRQKPSSSYWWLYCPKWARSLTTV